MTNLAQEQQSYQAEVVQFPKNERQAMSDKDEGYTPMPNFICDEGYLAVLDGNAIKCLWLLNRHVKGFHLKAKGMSEALVMKITGIKDGRTVQKYMGELAKVQLIKIEKERGKSNVYSLTFNDRLPTQNVGASKAKAQSVPTPDVGTPPTQHVGGSTYMACGSVKEIDLKENIKEIHTQENTCEKIDFSNDWKPEISFLKTLLCQTKFGHQTSEILSMSDFQFHLGNFNSHWENKTPLTENQKHRKFALWLIQEFEKAQNKKTFSEKQTSSRDVNQKWGEVQEYAPATGEVDLEGLI